MQWPKERRSIRKSLAHDWSSQGRAGDDQPRAVLEIRFKPIVWLRPDDPRESHEVSLNARFWCGIGSASTSGGGGMRSVTWRRLRIFLDLPGAEVTLKWFWPRWQESMEDYLYDQDLYTRQETSVRHWLASVNCPDANMVEVWSLKKGPDSLLPDEVRMIDGEVRALPALMSYRCATCGVRHGLYDPEIGALLGTPSRATQRREEDAASRLRAEGAALLSESSKEKV